MKLRDITLTAETIEDQQYLKVTGSSVELCACGSTSGEAKAFVPVKILNAQAGVNPAVATVTELKVSSDTQSNSRGVRRVMVKVELPYQSLPEADVAAQGGIIDTRRSGQALSAHIVISIPKTAAEDLTGSRGLAAQKAAIAQVRGACSLLLAFSSPEMAGGSSLDSAYVDGSSLTQISEKIPGEGTTIPATDSRIFTSGRVNHGRAKIVSDALNGQPGLSFTDMASEPLDAYDPLWRGLLGQRPLACGQDAVLPATFVTGLN